MLYLSALRHDIASGVTVEPDRQKIDTLVTAVYDAAAVVELVADPQVEAASRKAIIDVTEYLGVLEECAERGELTEEAEEHFIESSTTFQELRKAAQRDIQSLLPLIPAPPSVPTS
ncbi:hypothetical protein SAMN04488074_108236 [Lentzea albidocapillata subsp. violacea]|uniref:Uncharacterized protein n=2 Tax=Lentzea albidocapillata TaxID=40571 RepID=A0A1G9GL25_9PSEU|nr:hypothetical protein SAMN04488074_108236 [Lentzea albidocapillata subsp. violacea]